MKSNFSGYNIKSNNKICNVNADQLGFRYWKMSLVVMVITRDTLNLLLVPSALVINSMCSLVITITTRDIFQYLKANRSALTLHILLLDSIL